MKAALVHAALGGEFGVWGWRFRVWGSGFGDERKDTPRQKKGQDQKNGVVPYTLSPVGAGGGGGQG